MDLGSILAERLARSATTDEEDACIQEALDGLARRQDEAQASGAAQLAQMGRQHEEAMQAHKLLLQRQYQLDLELKLLLQASVTDRLLQTQRRSDAAAQAAAEAAAAAAHADTPSAHWRCTRSTSDLAHSAAPA